MLCSSSRKIKHGFEERVGNGDRTIEQTRPQLPQFTNHPPLTKPESTVDTRTVLSKGSIRPPSNAKNREPHHQLNMPKTKHLQRLIPFGTGHDAATSRSQPCTPAEQSLSEFLDAA